MKTTLMLFIALLTVASANAQGLRPEAVNGALVGGIAGAIIGNNSGDLRHNGWRGAAYGAGAGLLIGSMVGHANDQRYATQVPASYYPRTYVYRNTPAYYGYGHYGRPSHYGRHGGNYGYVSTEAPLYSDNYYGGTDYAGSGLLWGALAGAVIGNNSGSLRHNAWRGAAYGAATGYILGSIAESNARRRESAVTQVVTTPAPNYAEAPEPIYPSAQASSAEASPKPSAPASSMSAANSLFGRK